MNYYFNSFELQTMKNCFNTIQTIVDKSVQRNNTYNNNNRQISNEELHKILRDQFGFKNLR